MSSIIDNSPRRSETSVKPALQRAKRFNLLAAIAVAALFSVLAVKAQVAPDKPHWTDIWPGYETRR